MRYSTFTGLVACEPFESTSLKKQGDVFKTLKDKGASITTKVVFPCSSEQFKVELEPGDEVHLRADVVTLPWVREVFQVGGVDVIFVPVDRVLMVGSAGGETPEESAG